MRKGIKITFPVKKKNRTDIYKLMAEYSEDGENRCFTLTETNRDLQRKHHNVTHGCLIEDLVTGEAFKCIEVTLTPGKSKYPVMLVTPV